MPKDRIAHAVWAGGGAGEVSRDALFSTLDFASSNYLKKYIALQDRNTLANTIITRVSSTSSLIRYKKICEFIRVKVKKRRQIFPSKNSFLPLGNAKHLARKETYLPSTVDSVATSKGGDNFMLFMRSVWTASKLWIYVNCIKLMLLLTWA